MEAVERKKLNTVIAASSAGTLIEWYDFYIFGSLATVLAAQFFPKENPTAALLSTLALFATGFVVRPFGALVFGRIGDLVGRKYAFLVTLLMMGFSTFAIGLVPNYSQIGVFAPLLVLVLRLTQGLALGGEYGGAATYVAEHAPDNRRGYYTSFIQTTATLGLLVSIAVIIGGQIALGKEAFESWGWRIPFLLSSVLVFFSYIVRRKLQESPLFAEMKAERKQSKHPWKESFGNWQNLKLVLLALFGATAGQGVVWYTGQFYALVFLQTNLHVEKGFANTVVAIALILATPLFIVFGALSDRIGRKKIMMAGCLLAVICYIPIFSAIRNSVDTATWKRTFSDDTYSQRIVADPKTGIESKVTDVFVDYLEGSSHSITTETPGKKTDKKIEITPNLLKMPILICLVFILVAFVTMVYGPIAAFLVELFPTRIRYSSMSLPYHIGNGVFGGLVPLIATAVVASTGNLLAGLYYPIGIAAITFCIGMIFLPDRRDVSLMDDHTTAT